ncbi:TadE/TadG family type IV pilus assembly protein [Tropicibacter sp. Alg240-R139]|uniref:TadE/TadG family type IV pilus assembly protein n=1 Tax=Tropicibacter sp. Alg240-R139 TaxID=2305991 RepID=UPI0013E0E476|nr:TadE/TadG family type IV pilus assembly protein [Tropicibacter sp. Alg240-R139]
MIKRMVKRFRRFSDDERGNATVEFALLFPLLMVAMLSGIELAFVTLKHAMLERAVDMTVRDIRLGTGVNFQHDDLKTTICERATFIKSCDANMRLEMIQVDPRSPLDIDGDPDCTDRTEEVKPVRSFVSGASNDLMILRACAKIDPLFPTSGLGKQLADNAEGQYALVATTVFVQEPQ